jgi:adenylyltransferase/sulfurtransferase
MLKFNAESCEFTVFPDGRAIIKGTNDVERARTLYAKYIGH